MTILSKFYRQLHNLLELRAVGLLSNLLANRYSIDIGSRNLQVQVGEDFEFISSFFSSNC